MANLQKNDKAESLLGKCNIVSCQRYMACGFVLHIGISSLTELGFGAIVWDASIALLRYFEERKISFARKKVIELGSGTGILGILTVLLGGDVTITDLPNLLQQMEWNVNFNVPRPCRPRIKVRALSWGYDHSSFPSDYDCILCAEIMYSCESLPLIVSTLLHLSNEKTIIYFASKMTIYPAMTDFGYQYLSQYFNCKFVYRDQATDVDVHIMTKIIESKLAEPKP